MYGYGTGVSGTDKDESVLIEPAALLPQKEDDARDVPKLSYKAVKEWQSKMHPRDRENDYAEFDWFSADLKYLPISLGCINKTEWVTPEARAIGLGPTLFLYTMKAFAYLFLFFFLINLPIVFFYTKG